MSRADELRREAECFARAAAFLNASAERKLALANQIEKIDEAEGLRKGGQPTPPPRLAGHPNGRGE